MPAFKEFSNISSNYHSRSNAGKAGGLLFFLLLILMPVSTTVFPYIHGLVIAVAVMGSVIFHYMFGNRNSIEKDEKTFFISIIISLGVILVVSLFSVMGSEGQGQLVKFLLLIMIFPVYFFFRRYQFDYAALWYGLVAGAFISVIVGLYEIIFEVYKPGYPGRAKGATHPIIFGNLALLMGVMSMAGLGWFRARAKWQVILPVLALSSGLLASVLSQARGGWVAIPVFVLIFFWVSRAYFSVLKQLLSFIALMVFISLIYFIPQTGMQSKVEHTVESVQKYLDVDSPEKFEFSSIGSRFEMWKASWIIFKKNPVLGVGWGKYQEQAKKLVENGEISAIAVEHIHPHNQFLSVMVSGGILALIAFLILIYVPAKIFVDVIRFKSRSVDAQRVALAGLIFLVGFVVFNFSESLFERSRSVSFFIFYLAVCMVGIRDYKELR